MTKPPAEFLKATQRVGERVAALRKQQGLTQDELAKKAGISRNQIQNIERNRNNTRDPRTGEYGPANPSLETLYRLAGALKVSVSSLISHR